MSICVILLAALAVANGGSADQEGKVAFKSRFNDGFGTWVTTNNAAAPVDFVFTNIDNMACLRVSKHSEKDRGTRWGFTSESFAVDGGAPAYLELAVRGNYRLHVSESPWRGTSCRFFWYDGDGKEVGDEKFAVKLPGEVWKWARVNIRIPDNAVRGTVTIGAQHPQFRKPGEYFAIAALRFVTNATWRGGDGEGPYLDVLTPSPNEDLRTTIRFRLTDETGVDHSKTRIVFDGKDAGGLFAREGDVYSCPAPAGGWKKFGVYRLKVNACDTLGNTRTEETLFYFDAPVKDGVFSLRDDGMFLWDGKPFFPLGIAGLRPTKANGKSLEAAVRQCKEAGFNNVSRYGLWSDRETADAWFDLVEKYGLLTVTDTEATRARDDDESRIENVRRSRNRSCVFVWEVADDTSNFRSGDEVRASHRFVRAIDNHALTGHADAVWPWHADTYRPYVRSADVFQFELYPFHSDSPWNRSRSLAVLVDSIERVKRTHRETGTAYAGFIGIIQDFIGWSDWKMMPSYEEVRAMSYLAVIHGCRGLRWYAYSGEGSRDPLTRAASDDPKTWAELSCLVHELGGREAVLTARDARVQPEVRISEGPEKDAFGYDAVTCLFKDVPGGFLIAVNHTTNALTASFCGGGVDVTHVFKGNEVFLCDGQGKVVPPPVVRYPDVQIPCKETKPTAKMDSGTKDPGRGPGPFGEFWWANRFLSRIEQVRALKGKTVDVVLVGDSIMHFWEWKHPESWRKFTDGRTVLNCGYGGDMTQNAIWRLVHGELDGYKARNVVIMIGTNNNTFQETDPANVARGVEKIVAIVRSRQPDAKIILHPIFPRGASAESKPHAAARQRNDQTNHLLEDFAKKDGKVVWLDFNRSLTDETGWVPRRLMADEIHPTDEGYDIWLSALEQVLAK